MKTALRRAWWLLMQGGMAAGIYYGGVLDVEWASNVVRFAAWCAAGLMIPVSLITFLAYAVLGDDAARVTELRPAVPLYLDHATDFLLACGMAAVGWFVTAGVYATQIVALAIICQVATKQATALASPPTAHPSAPQPAEP